MNSLTLIYLTDAAPGEGELKAITEALHDIRLEVLSVRPTEANPHPAMSSSVSGAQARSFGHALAESTGEVIHIIPPGRVSIAPSDYRKSLAAFAESPTAGALFTSKVADSAELENPSKQDLRVKSILSFLNPVIRSKDFLRISATGGANHCAVSNGSFLFRRSALGQTPPPPGCDEAAALAALPLMVATAGWDVLSRTNILARTVEGKAKKEEVPSNLERQRNLLSLAWVLDWWLAHTPIESVAPVAHLICEPLRLIELARSRRRYSPFITKAVLDCVGVMQMITDSSIDPTALLRDLQEILRRDGSSEFSEPRSAEILRFLETSRSIWENWESIVSDAQDSLLEAEKAFQAQRYDEAEKIYQEVVTKFPNLLEAHIGLAESSLRTKHFDTTDRCVELLKREGMNCAALTLRLGNVLFALQRISEAKECYYRSISLDSQNPSAAFNLAFIAYREGKSEEALPFARAALRHQPGDPDLQEFLALLCLETNRKPEAKEILDGLKVMFPHRPPAAQLLERARIQ